MPCEHSQSNHTASRQKRWPEAVYLFFVLLFVAAILLLAYRFGIILCPLKRFTGIPCPICGSTRAVVCALKGDFAGAFRYQPLVMTLVIVAVPLMLAAKLSHRVRNLLALALHSPFVWVLICLALAANWAYVILHGN